ncbi:MAG: DUF4340 domain-containing protein [Aggregatilineales bacterium]
MRLNRNTLLLLVGSLILIGGALFILNGTTDSPSDDDDSQTDTTGGSVFADLQFSDIVALTVRDNSDNGGETAFSQADDGAWQIDATDDPQPGTLAQSEIDTAIVTLAGLEFTDRFVPVDNDLSVYGLDTPAYTVQFMSGDDTGYSLQAGNTNPGATRYYALVGDDTETVHLLSDVAGLNAVTTLALAPPYILEPTATPIPSVTIPGMLFARFTAFNIQSVLIEDLNNDTQTVIRQDENGNALADDDTLLDGGIVSIAIGVLNTLEAVDALPADDLANFGLDNPAYRITIQLPTQDIVLNIGTEDVSKTRYYVQVDESETIAVIEKTPVDIVLDLLRDPPLLLESTPQAEATENSDADE